MPLNVSGVASMVVFYLLILFVGIWAGWKRKRRMSANSDDVMLGNRSFGLVIGVITMTATWVSGAYINGTAEIMYKQGLAWCQAPIGYSLSVALGGILFANKMREQGYVTMLDPFQEKYGARMGGLLFIPPLLGEMFWSAAILASLGATVGVIIDLDTYTSIILSSCIIIFYTLFGGIYSVAYTDIIQLLLIVVGLWICVPFVFINPSVSSEALSRVEWAGSIKFGEIGLFVDSYLLLIFGGIPWQMGKALDFSKFDKGQIAMAKRLGQNISETAKLVECSRSAVSYFQRILSIRDTQKAQVLCYIAAVGCFLMSLPSIAMGIAAKAAAWNTTSYGMDFPSDQTALTLPMVLQYLTPKAVSFLGLGAVSAAVMSSADASILSAASMFARNVYRNVFRQKASTHEVILMMRLAIAIVGTGATAMAVRIHSIYDLWYLASDILYVIMFPQLLCVVYFKTYVNTYGSLAAYIIGLVLRILGGDEVLGIPAVIHYPFFDFHTEQQYFPFKTLSMLVSLWTLLSVSFLFRWIFQVSMLLPSQWDIFKCFQYASERNGEIQMNNNIFNTYGTNNTLNSSVRNNVVLDPVGVINPAVSGDMIELQDKKLAKLELIKSEIVYGSHGESTDV